MRPLRTIALAAGLAALGACIPRGAAPAPAAAPAPVPAPAPVTRPTPPRPEPSAPAAPAVDWEQAPLTPGDWTWRPGPPSSAGFGSAAAPLLTIRCTAPGRIAILRAGAGANSLTFRSSAMTRSVAATPEHGGAMAALAAGDPLLDALAFSRGRFAVEAAGVPALVVPAWPELARVVEDCRR